MFIYLFLIISNYYLIIITIIYKYCDSYFLKIYIF